MAIALVSASKTVTAWTGSAVTSPQTFSPVAGLTAGNKAFVVAWIGRTSPSSLTCTDNSAQTGTANVWTLAAGHSSTNIALGVFYCDLTRSILSTDLFTISWTGGTAAFAAGVSEWTGCPSGIPVSVVGTNGTTGSPNTGPLSAAAVGDLIVGWFDWSSQTAFTAGTDGQGNTMTALHAPTAASFKGGGAQYELVTGTLAYTPTNTSVSGGAWASVGVRVSTTASVSPPVNTVAPAVTGTPTVGSTLTCSQGTWVNDVSSGYTYQWKDGAGNISGATSSVYVIGAGESGATIRCTVTATGTGGTTAADSNTVVVLSGASYAPILNDAKIVVCANSLGGTVTTPVVLGSPPVNVSAPTISGPHPFVQVGDTLTADPGGWTDDGAGAFAYQWQNSPDGVAFTDIAGTINPTYLVQATDSGLYVRVEVTDTDGNGTTGPVLSGSLSPPAVASAPVLIRPRVLHRGRWFAF